MMIRHNAGTTAAEGGFSRPMDAIYFPGFSRGLTPCSFDTHQGARFLSHSAVRVTLINFDNTNGQTGAKALNLVSPSGG